MKRYLMCAVFVIFSATVSMGQMLTNYDRRNMNNQLLDLIYSYERYASFGDSNVQYAFVDMFAHPDAPVYCDYVAADKFDKTMTASEYAQYSTESLGSIYIQVRDVTKSSYIYDGRDYFVDVEFKKCIEYEDEINTFFSSYDKAIGNFQIKMKCIYKSAEKKFYIQSISGKPSDSSTFPKGDFIILQKKSVFDEQVKANNRELAFNEFNDAYLPANSVFTIDDDDIVITAHKHESTERYQKMSLSYRPTRLRFRADASISPALAYTVKSPIDFSLQKSFAFEINADIGYAFPIDKVSKLAMYTGLGLSFSNLRLGVSDINYQYTFSDPSSVSYTRQYQIASVTEGLSFVDFVLPFYVSYERLIDSKFVLSADAGLKLYLNAKTNVEPYSVTGTVTSIYEGGSTTQISLPQYVDDYMIPATYSRNTYDLAAFVKLGADYKINKTNLVFMRLGYLQGLTNAYTSNMSTWFDETDAIYPFVYSSKTNSDVAVRSFMDCISYRRCAFTIDFGYKLKF